MSIEEQNKHQLYKDAHERFLRAEGVQNIKAAAKYPEPLNPASWTAEGLADHAAQEAVDMLRYIEALKVRCAAYEYGVGLIQGKLHGDDWPENKLEFIQEAINHIEIEMKGATYK